MADPLLEEREMFEKVQSVTVRETASEVTREAVVVRMEELEGANVSATNFRLPARALMTGHVRELEVAREKAIELNSMSGPFTTNTARPLEMAATDFVTGDEVSSERRVNAPLVMNVVAVVSAW